MEDNINLDNMKKDALFAYLEYCNLVKSTPEKEVYQILTKCKNGQKLDRMTSFIELEDGEYQKGKSSESILETFNSRFIEEFQLKKRELSQEVTIDVDDEKKIMQCVTYDPVDEWMCLGNAGNEISLSVENYKKLFELGNKVLNSDE